MIEPDPEHGRVLVLRDPEGVAEASLCIPPPLIPVVARFTGENTCAQIARDLSRELGTEVDVEAVVRAAKTLEKALFLEGPAYSAAREKIVSTFTASSTLVASDEGGWTRRRESCCFHYALRNGQGECETCPRVRCR